MFRVTLWRGHGAETPLPVKLCDIEPNYRLENVPYEVSNFATFDGYYRT